jgi:hypothetical protein
MARALPDAGARLLDRFSDDVHEVILRLRQRIFAVAPRAHEIVADVGYTVSLQYGPDDKVGNVVCYIAGFASHANLGFTKGALLADPAEVMEGTGARMRHIKFRSVEETEASWLDRYIAAAIAQSDLTPTMGDVGTTLRLRARRS